MDVTTPLIMPVMDMSCPGSVGKDCFNMLKSMGFGDLVRLAVSLRRSDRGLTWLICVRFGWETA